MLLPRRARIAPRRGDGPRRSSFIYVPLLVVLINSFNPTKAFSWPPPRLHARVVEQGVRTTPASATALVTSVKAALGATLDRAGARARWSRSP